MFLSLWSTAAYVMHSLGHDCSLLILDVHVIVVLVITHLQCLSIACSHLQSLEPKHVVLDVLSS